MQFQIGNQTLVRGSWEKVLPTLAENSVDLLLTDPPYDTTSIDWDKAIDLSRFWNEAHRVCKPTAILAVFASGKFIPKLLNSNLKNYRYELIWEKNMAVGFLHANKRPLRAHEQILIFSEKWGTSTYNPQKNIGKPHKVGGTKLGERIAHYSQTRLIADVKTDLYHPRSVLKYGNTLKGKSLHPTAKPLELVEFLLRSYSDPGDFVLDPFVGSGTTLAAALLNDRRGFGVELNQKHFQTAKKRLIEIEKTISNA